MILGRTLSFLRSLTSRVLRGRVNDHVFALRVISCFGDGDSIKPCTELRFSNMHHYCGACGCGESVRLSSIGSEPDDPIFIDYVKLHYPYLECPLKKKGFSNEDRGNDSKQ